MSDSHAFAISTAARMLGLTPHTLRKWEDRYGAVSPSRTTGGDRRYSRADIERLARLKELVDAGHPISAIAKLSDGDIEELLGESLPDTPSEELPVRLGVLGKSLAHQLTQSQSRMPGVAVAASTERAEELRGQDVDVVVLELAYLSDTTREKLRDIRSASGVASLAVLYKFAALKQAENLSDARTALVCRPVNHRELARTLQSIAHSGVHYHRPALGLPPHRFTRELLINVATMAPALACECPRHTAQLIVELHDFEKYSEQCEQTKPQDAAIHNMLRRTAAVSRSLFEDALIELAEAEDFDLDMG